MRHHPGNNLNGLFQGEGGGYFIVAWREGDVDWLVSHEWRRKNGKDGER